jgi:uncharacterized protein (TIGR00369 family)
MGYWQDLLSGYVDGSAEEPIANQKLGLGPLDEWRPGYASKRWPVDSDLFHGRALFGGYLAALADQMLGLAAMTVLDDQHFFGTTNMTINYLAPVIGGEVLVEAHVVSQRKRSILVECSFTNGNELVAKAWATQVLYPRS